MDGIMDTMMTFYVANMLVINLLLITILLLSLYLYVNRYELALKWSSFKHNLPLLGKISKWKGELDEDKSTGWFTSEKQLCSEYDIHYLEASKQSASFNNANEYLSAVEESGRTPMGALIWLGIVLITVVEAYGLAKIVAPYVDMNSSSEHNAIAAMGIALLLSIALVLFTHFAGAEVHKNHLLNNVNDGYDKDDDKNGSHLQASMNPSLDKNEEDLTHKPWQRLLNRIYKPNKNARTSYILSWTTGFLVVAVFIAAIWIRVEGLDNAIYETTQVQSSTSSDMFATGDAQVEFTGTSTQPSVSQSFVYASWITFALLALVFVAIQVIGVLVGSMYGFAGEHSKAAYKAIKRFDQEEDFLSFYRQQRALISAIAQNNLLKLQKAMIAHNKAESNASNIGITESLKNTGARTFEAYLEQFGTKKDEAEKLKKQKMEDEAAIHKNDSGIRLMQKMEANSHGVADVEEYRNYLAIVEASEGKYTIEDVVAMHKGEAVQA